MKHQHHYQATSIASEVFQASPHRLVQMLFEGALKNMFVSKGCVSQGMLEEAQVSLNKANRIISELQASLKFQFSSELPQNLYYIYDYIKCCLIFGAAQSDVAKIDEAIRLLKEIKAGWDAIPEDIRHMDEEQLKQQVA